MTATNSDSVVGQVESLSLSADTISTVTPERRKPRTPAAELSPNYCRTYSNHQLWATLRNNNNPTTASTTTGAVGPSTATTVSSAEGRPPKAPGKPTTAPQPSSCSSSLSPLTAAPPIKNLFSNVPPNGRRSSSTSAADGGGAVDDIVDVKSTANLASSSYSSVPQSPEAFYSLAAPTTHPATLTVTLFPTNEDDEPADTRGADGGDVNGRDVANTTYHASLKFAPLTLNYEDVVEDPTNGKIAIFDSGVGGLSVVKEIASQLPNEDILYFGDSKNCPYGEKTSQQIQGYCYNIVKYLSEVSHVKAVVIACNTATAIALDFLQTMLPIPVVGMIGPGALAAAAVTSRKQKIGIMATKGTISNRAYEMALRNLRIDLNVVAHATPKLAPLIEHCEQIGEEEMKIIAEQVDIFRQEQVDTLILGCTHYPHIAKYIQEVVGEGVRLVDPAVAAVMHLKLVLNDLSLLKAEPPTSPVLLQDCAGNTNSSGAQQQQQQPKSFSFTAAPNRSSSSNNGSSYLEPLNDGGKSNCSAAAGGGTRAGVSPSSSTSSLCTGSQSSPVVMTPPAMSRHITHNHKFFTSADAEHFEFVANKWLSARCGKITVHLHDL